MTPAVIAMDTSELPIYEINSADLKGISKFTSIPWEREKRSMAA